jgi:D-sedoheptulose 7-phosphate isomerase
LVRAVETAKAVGAGICGIVGREGGVTARSADACVIVPQVSVDRVTPHTESFQSVVLHLLVSHPRLQTSSAKWESLK